jgi:hypothetical protein
MCDKLVFDLAQEVEGSPSVFIRKDWINILDNQTSNYTSNQSVLDTSQLSNSSKYMSYRESYFLIPMTLTIASNAAAANGSGKVTSTGSGTALLSQALVTSALNSVMQPAQLDPVLTASDLELSYGLDNCIGLKNWFGNIIHSFTLDYNGSTIIQQTPFVNMWNSFKLMTSLSYNDVITQGCTIGFYPDDAECFSANFVDNINLPVSTVSTTDALTLPAGANLAYFTGGNNAIISGNGVVNNATSLISLPTQTQYQNYNSGSCNEGLFNRIKWISYDAQSVLGLNNEGAPLKTLLTQSNCNTLWKSFIVSKVNQVNNIPAAGPSFNYSQTTPGLLQYGIIATVYLKHVHSFFNMCPLLKGVFMKMTMNLNNSACSVVVGSRVGFPATAVPAGTYPFTKSYAICNQASSALGGVNPIMLASVGSGNGAQNLAPKYFTTAAASAAAVGTIDIGQPYRLSLSVGQVCLDAQTTSIAGINLSQGGMQCKSIYLYIPAYTFNPTFEQSYISSPVKAIKYTDIYQYQVLNVGGGLGGTFNNLLTNGIANVKSVLILPFYSAQGDTASTALTLYDGTLTIGNNTGFVTGVPVWQSPFDPAGTGPTSPLCHFTNFNVQVSGQNAIYNLQLRAFEQFNNQLYGQNAVNGGLTDGITSSLINRQNFDLEYCYYYVNVERMLPVEQSVPKSIQIVGNNMSEKKVDLLCFIEYGTEVQIDVLTGARV